MHGGAARKFIDTDVRKHPELLAAAVEYARAYVGEFEPIIEAQEEVYDTGTLRVASARRVLNCMRYDRYVVIPQLSSEGAAVLPIVPKQTARRCDIVDLPVRIKAEYFSPKAMQGALHVVEDAFCRWHKQRYWGGRYHWLDTPQGELRIQSRCGKSYTSNNKLVFYNRTSPHFDNRNLCKAGCWPKEDE
jgi:hypothetical protein